ncbi:MAG: iron ABC transporter permease [Burkholderiales bacterium]|nr:iron ABC transporter permease [Burkholderiales bacterium]
MSLFFGSSADVWSHLMQTVLPRYVRNSAMLALTVAVGVGVLGTACAWCMAALDFPGRRWLEWALVLPLAMPAYVVAYAYTDLLQFSGPVQSALRELTGWRAREYWFPEIRSLYGAAVLFVLVLFPYVYLPVRAAFLERSPNLYHAARLAGLSGGAAFRRAVLPVARPALAAGVTLAVMETLADYGTVAYFALETFTTGIYNAWFSLGDRAAAAQLSLLLLGVVALVIWLERVSRGRARYQSRSLAAAPRRRVPGMRGWGLTCACLLPFVLGFLLPAVVLLQLAWRDVELLNLERYLRLLLNSVTVSGAAALLCVALALALAYAVRLQPSPAVRVGVRLSALGYAVPGAVLAVAILVPLARVDNAIATLLREQFDMRVGLLLTGSIAALLYAYLVRFLALALSNAEAGLARITPSMDEAARSLGCDPWRMALRVHAPLLARSLLIGLLLVFVDVLKELPATLVLRPFDFDTLATQAYNLAKDERLGEAAVPSLTIVAAGLMPVIMLCSALRDGRGMRR